MRRRDLLKSITRDIANLNVTFPLYEVYLSQDNFPSLTIPRTIFIEGAPSEFHIVSLFESFAPGYSLTEGSVAKYETAEEIITSDLINQNSLNLWLNWRGRICKWDKLNDCSDENQFLEMTVASYWRLFVTQKDNDFFTRYDIVPSYYNPGFSTVGLENFRSDIEKFLRYLKRLQELRDIDPEFDRIVLYSRREPNQVFQRCIPNFFQGSNYISYNNLNKAIITTSEDYVVNSIYQSIKHVLNN